jgi:hypothetical protein
MLAISNSCALFSFLHFGKEVPVLAINNSKALVFSFLDLKARVR